MQLQSFDAYVQIFPTYIWVYTNCYSVHTCDLTFPKLKMQGHTCNRLKQQEERNDSIIESNCYYVTTTLHTNWCNYLCKHLRDQFSEKWVRIISGSF